MPPTRIRGAPVTLLGSMCWLSQSHGYSPPAPCRCPVGHGDEQCLLLSHLLYQSPCHKPCSLLHMPSSPCSLSSGIRRHSLSQQFAKSCGGRLCGTDSYRQALPCSSLCKGLWKPSKCLKYNLPSPKGAEKGSHKVQTISHLFPSVFLHLFPSNKQ